jgi:hypothetical protein
MSCNRFQNFFEIVILENKLFYSPTGLYEKEKRKNTLLWVIPWKPLNVITENFINQLILSIFQAR